MKKNDESRLIHIRGWRLWTWLLWLGQWFIVCLAGWVVLCTLLYPDWWRAFFWDGGVFDTAHWNLGIATVKEQFGQFWPLGGLLVTLGAVILARFIFLYGRHGKQCLKHLPLPR